MTFLWLAAFVLAVILMVVFIPSESIRRFSQFGLVAGFLLGVITLYLMIHVFGYWRFAGDFFTIAGVPLLLALTWWPVEIAFAYYFVHTGMNNFNSYLLAMIPPTVLTFFHYLALRLDLLDYRYWTMLETFLLSVLIHVSLALYLKSAVEVRN